MNRSIYCRGCGEKNVAKGVHPEDRKTGWKKRHCYIAGVPPKGHGVTVITGKDAVLKGKGKREFVPFIDLLCDLCGDLITGQVCVAVTMWRPEQEPEPCCWEADYGQVLSSDSLQVDDLMTDTKKGKP